MQGVRGAHEGALRPYTVATNCTRRQAPALCFGSGMLRNRMGSQPYCGACMKALWLNGIQQEMRELLLPGHAPDFPVRAMAGVNGRLVAPAILDRTWHC